VIIPTVRVRDQAGRSSSSSGGIVHCPRGIPSSVAAGPARLRPRATYAPATASFHQGYQKTCTVVHDLWDALSVSRGHDVDLARLSGEAASEIADTMQALAASSRVRILGRLTAGPCSVKELARAVEMEQQLRLLRDLGLVVGKRQGRKTIYRLHDKHVAVLLAEAVAHTEHTRRAGVRKTLRAAH
jgi:DNA-binding transcriptional ArsR family regulator